MQNKKNLMAAQFYRYIFIPWTVRFLLLAAEGAYYFVSLQSPPQLTHMFKPMQVWFNWWNSGAVRSMYYARAREKCVLRQLIE